jgi:MFS transporter, ACS family, 4-hydroxyphenylacetate permease
LSNAPVGRREPDPALEDKVIRKVFRRLIWFLFVLYVCSYLDRVNIGYAALSMNKDLGLSATMFGFANTLFYLGYVLCEIPSNLILAKVGARIWIPRIMITWGLCSMATIFAQGPNSLYLLRLLVGIAEAGFLPGVLLYLTFWFPPSYRGRATAVFMIAQPFTLTFGSTLSGLLLAMDGYWGLSGWRWLFLLVGLPSIFLGVAAYFYLADRPESVGWLSASESKMLTDRIQREQAANPVERRSVWQVLTSPEVLCLSAAYFGLVTTLNTIATWGPQIVREVMLAQKLSYVTLISAIPPLITMAAMPWWSARSDRSGERVWNFILPVILAAIGWQLVAYATIPEIRLLGLILCTVGGFCGMAIFWTMPASALPLATRPAGIALISMAGLSASALSPLVVGVLKDLTQNFIGGILYVTGMLVVAAIAIKLASTRRSVDAVSLTTEAINH